MSELNAQVGKGIYYTSFNHAAIIVSLNRESTYPFKVTSVAIAESNWANVWEDPTGQRPWERTITSRTIAKDSFSSWHIADIDN